MTDLEFIKRLVSKHALKYVKKEMIIGLGTGSTAGIFIKELAKLNRREALRVIGVPTSDASMRLAKDLGINIAGPDEINSIDIAFDGADEVDPSLNLIKGGGGALLMEKIVASCSKQFIIIVDPSKIVSKLGKFPLPVEVVQFGSERIKEAIERFLITLGYQMPKVTCRRSATNKYVTDQHNYILDLHLNEILDPKTLSLGLLQIVGVVEVGLFIDMASKIIIGNDDGSCKVI